jgi:hypothetical protein
MRSIEVGDGLQALRLPAVVSSPEIRRRNLENVQGFL